MSFTEPAYALPIILDGTETLVIAFSAGVSNTVTATMTAGTYYNFRITDITGADSLTKMIDDALDAGETAASNTASWVESEPSTGLTFRMQLDRTGDTGDVVSSMTISDDNLRQAMGFSELVVNNVTELSNAADDTTLEGSYQRGYLWVPRTILGRDERIPLSQVAGKITPVGRAVVDGYGQYDRIRHVIEFVPGPLVYTDKAADSDFQGVQVDGLALGDDTAPLDQFWRLCREGAAGPPPVIKFIADTAATSVTEDIVIADLSWLTDMDNVAEEMSPAPLLYRVRIEAMESVGTSFVSTGPTIGSCTDAGVSEYDTYNDLPTSDNTEGDWAAVITTGAAGGYRWMESLSSTTVKAWVPAEYYQRIITGGFLVNGGGDKHSWLSSNGGGPNTAAALPTLGWITTGSSGAYSITDVAGDTRLDATGGNAFMDFATVWPSGQIFIMMQYDQTLRSGHLSGLVDLEQSTYSLNYRMALGAQAFNNVAWQTAGGSPSSGNFSIPSFNMLFGVVAIGTVLTNDTKIQLLWDADAGWTKTEGAEGASNVGAAVDRGRLLVVGPGSQLDVRRYQVFSLGQ